MQTLKMHRHSPWLRCFNEFLALLGTAFVGSLAYTAYNAYNAPKGTFTLEQCGFFSKPTSLKKANSIFDMLEIQYEEVGCST